METYLVVTDDSDSTRELAEYAAQIAEPLDAELIFGRFVDEDEYQNRLQRAASTSREIESIEEATAHAEELAEEFAVEAVGDRDVSYRSVGIVDTMPRSIVEFARDEGVEQIFISGERRSPTGKAIFGDQAQHVILNFDGFVTVNKAE